MIVLELSSRDLGRINSVDLLVSKYYRTSLYNFCQKYSYDKLFVEIIRQVTDDYGYDKVGYFSLQDNPEISVPLPYRKIYTQNLRIQINNLPDLILSA